jgi:CBS domain-containing protein
MARNLHEVMTPDPFTLPSSSSVFEAAKVMRDSNIGDVLVVDGGKLAGIVTDRDITVRVVAEGKDPKSTAIKEICTGDVVGVAPNDSVERAVRMMREKALRRLPVVEDGRPIGVVSIGDLALERDPESALADISAAPPNR